MKPCAVVAAWLGCALVVLPAGAAPAFDLVLAYTVGIAVGTDANNTDIVVARRDGSAAKTLIGGDTHDYEPTWSPKGDRIAFVRRAPCDESGSVCASLPDDLWVAGEDGIGARPVTFFRPDRGNTYAYSPSWSPDGSRIAHCRGTPIDTSLWISRVDRRASRRVPGASCREVAWAPDGRRLAVVRDTDVVLVTPAGRLDRVLMPIGSGIVWSPDGTRVAYATGRGLYTITTNGTARTRRLQGRGFVALRWSRAALILAGKQTIYSRSVATGQIRTLVTLPRFAGYADWRP
jgi:Tol biopolymer transport system component